MNEKKKGEEQDGAITLSEEEVLKDFPVKNKIGRGSKDTCKM